MNIRRAEIKDIPTINTLLYQVNNVHADGRDDIFIHNKKKYNDEELQDIIADDSTPVFVAEGENAAVLGYCFCIIQKPQSDNMMPITTLYIDDLCVLDNLRGQHIGSALYSYVRGYAKQIGCYHITLNVWCLNEGAMKFYEKCGLSPLKITMEDLV